MPFQLVKDLVPVILIVMRLLLSLWYITACLQVAAGRDLIRRVPSALEGHPGNVFLRGEEAVITVSPGQVGPYQVFDYEGRTVGAPSATYGRLTLGKLPVGYYKVQLGSDVVSLAVIEKLKAPTPMSSPIGADVATAWFYPKDKLEAVANLCALAGLNWVRDRLLWSELEPQKGHYANRTRYDDTALAQSRAGLRVLQVMHLSPDWATAAPKRFPPDLRDAYRFFREMAHRWDGQIAAFEPWNEADIPDFGGHTGSEMASFQKACWLGLKAGHRKVIVCQNVFALHNRAQLEDLHQNEVCPYFDTFNLHHYAPLDEYPSLYNDFRTVSAGRPLWVSECALPVKWSGDPALQEPTEADSRTLSERVVKVFACSLHEGAAETFYFLLPHYAEGPTQFGLLRKDLTPRPGYVALAAVGRLLASAKPLGRLECASPNIRGYLFAAKPDGRAAVVLVAWATEGDAELVTPLTAVGIYDHLGRAQTVSSRLPLSSAPLIAVFPAGTEKKWNLKPPPASPERLSGTACSVVLQALWPQTNIDLTHSAYQLKPGTEESIPLCVYNFGNSTVSGILKVTSPPGWETKPLPVLRELPPFSRTELELTFRSNGTQLSQVEAVRVDGEFGQAGRPVLSFRIF